MPKKEVKPKEPRWASGTESRKIEAGGKRLPGGVMSAEAADALDSLIADGYAPSKLQTIEKSVMDARKRYKPKATK
jgi:hypothetical protein